MGDSLRRYTSRGESEMPQITNNEDGSQTFAVNSSELKGFGEALGHTVRDVEKVLAVVDGPRFRDALSFVKSIVD
jgi:hypothetical protein